MPVNHLSDDEFLERVAAGQRSGLKMQEIAAQVGISPCLLTYHLRRLGYVTFTLVIDGRTRQPLTDRYPGKED